MSNPPADLKCDDIDLSRLSYSELGRLHNKTGSELNRRNTEARMANDEDGDW